jgi:hypothetical protein
LHGLGRLENDLIIVKVITPADSWGDWGRRLQETVFLPFIIWMKIKGILVGV